MKPNLKLIAIILLLAFSSCAKRQKVLVIIRGNADTALSSKWTHDLQVLLNKREDYIYEIDQQKAAQKPATDFLASEEMPRLLEKIKRSSGEYRHIVYCSAFAPSAQSAIINEKVNNVGHMPASLTIVNLPVDNKEAAIVASVKAGERQKQVD